ncbi:MAG: putative bifunctional diguanylate cyclase/phosphodiesterase [Nitrospirota bacterium]
MANRSGCSLRMLLVGLVLLAVLPAFALMLHTVAEHRRSAAANVQTNTLRLVKILSLNHARFIEGARQLLGALSQVPAVVDRDPAACAAALGPLLDRYPLYANLGAIETNGAVRCSALPIRGRVNAADRPYFQRAMASREFAVGDYQIGRISNRASINVGYPVLDSAGRVQVVIMAALDLDWLNRLIESASLPRGSVLTVIDRNGTVLLRHPAPDEWVGRSQAERPIIQTILREREGVTREQGPDGVERILAFTPLGSTVADAGAYVSLGVPGDVAFATADATFRRNMIGLSAAAAVALLAAWWGGGWLILRRVMALVDAARRLQTGDLRARTGLPHADSELGHLARAFDNMAEALEAKTASLAFQAAHDTLTNLPNRNRLVEHLRQAIRLGQRSGSPTSLLLVGPHRFREINNTLGHRNGDRLLREIGSRIQEMVRESDVVARVGGDTFAVLLPSIDLEGATLAADRILGRFKAPFLVNGMTIMVGVALGIVLTPEHGEDPEVLIRLADVALDQAKEGGHGYFVYAHDRDHYEPERLTLMGELPDAIERDQLFLVYQPKIDLHRRTVVGVEALVRWRHPQRGVIPPDRFILLAEHAGLIKPLTFWVLRTAFAQARAWRDAGLSLSVAANLSARVLQDPKLPDQIAARIAAAKADPAWIELEITESVIMANPDRARGSLRALHAMGVRLAIDDFGTGYSSLGYLKKLPVDTLKIDKSFVTDMASDPDSEVIVRSTIDLAHTLGLTVVAEGVEDQEAWDRLTAFGCDGAQGYYVSKPMPAENVTRWVNHQWPSHRASASHAADRRRAA